MLKIQMIGIMVVAGLVSCQKSSKSTNRAPNVEADKKEEGSKSGGTNDGNEIAIVNGALDLGACNSARRGKSYYILTEKNFRYCADSDQWDVIDLKGSDGGSGAAGKNSLVLTTPEVAGANCAAGGQKIQSGLDQNSNGQLDAGEVTATSFACNGSAGSVGASGAAGASGKNALVKSTVESAGANCASGGRKIEFGSDTNSDGVLAAGEVSGSTFVCNGSNGATGNDGADGDRYVGRILYTSAGTRLGEIIKEFEYLPASGKPSAANNWVTPSRLFIVRDTTNNYDVGYVASTFTDLTLPSSSNTSTSSQVHFRSRKYEELALTKLTPYHSALVYTNSSCNVSGALFAYNMQSSYIRTGACNSSCERMFKNRVLHDYLTGMGLTIAYNFSSTQDIVPNCASPVSNSNLQSHGISASCETIWNNYDISTTTPANGQVCSVSFVDNVFPDSIAAGWYVQRN